MKILNASPEFGKQLNEGETREFLTKSKLNVHIGTIDSKGDSNIHPTWYYYDTESDKFYIETSNSKKIENMEGKGLVYFCVDEPKFPYELEGRARLKSMKI
jgi:nitroimidazol reductase NimA-like FMN-containing flavoprotein (pyridoxamine 5'-phosphate oxidase superfamily)